MTTFNGTRLLLETFDIVGARIRDYSDPRRLWTVQSIYSPVGRALGGVRVKLIDDQDFFTFINQRDFEVLIDVGKPGELCPWTGRNYVGINDNEWVGFYVDEEDLLDDLQEREMLLRANHPGVLPRGIEITRRIHREKKVDQEELLTLIWDMDPVTGFGPDLRLETIRQRWVRIEQRRVTWPLQGT